MNKEEILAKSRNENQNQDLYEKDILIKSHRIAVLVMEAICLLFFLLEIFVKDNTNYAFMAIIFSTEATTFTVKAIKLKRKHEIIMAIAYSLLTIAFIAYHIYKT
ncbi:MAG: hypothetical protein K2F65_04735, partial [Eubacterium sp.]|nr:hypothetical protein [Eubacterium sp.]